MHSALITILAATLVFAFAIGLGSSRNVEVFALSTLVDVFVRDLLRYEPSLRKPGPSHDPIRTTL